MKSFFTIKNGKDLETKILYLTIFALIFHIIAPIMSIGFFKLDEQTGIMRFVAYKLGYLKASDLSNEFQFQIRSWAQPAFYFIIGKVYTFFAKYNPFHFAFLLRLASSLIGFYSIFIFQRSTQNLFKDSFHKLLYAFSLYTLWFIPYFHARPASENISTSLFIIGLSYLLKGLPKDALISNNKSELKVSIFKLISVGFLLAFSFTTRFQMSIIIFSLLIWIFFHTQNSLKKICILIISICLGYGATIIIDYWGYGMWTSSAYNYLDYNIFKGVASSFGTDPWYTYITKSFVKSIPPLSFLIVLPFFWLWYKIPKSLLTLLTLPFLLVHSAIGHKELRFIWTLIIFAPLIFTLYIQETNIFRHYKKLSIFLVGLNFILLIIASFKPAYTLMGFYKVVYQQKVEKLYHLGDAPRQFPFYLRKKIQYEKITPDSLKNINIIKKPYFLLIKNLSENKDSPSDCLKIYSAYPDWIIKPIFYKWLKRSKTWMLYKCS